MDIDIYNIKKIRRELGLTQKELSRLCGVSQSYITKIESGILEPTYTNAMKILETLRRIIEKNEIKAKDIMSTKIISIKPNDTIKKAVSFMKKHNISQLPVIDNNNLIGHINEKIILVNMSKDKNYVEDIMALPPPIVDVNSPLIMIKDLLKYWPLVLVIKNKKYVGIITKSDLLDNLINNKK